MTASQKYSYDFPQLGVTADVVCFSASTGALKTLLVKRSRQPFAGRWALPGGYVEIDELFEDAARRELAEETSLAASAVYPVGLFDAIDRDPRRRVVTFAYYALFNSEAAPQAGDDAGDARWFALDALPSPAFDHPAVVAAALRSLRRDSFLYGRFRELLQPAASAETVLQAVLLSPAAAQKAASALPDDLSRLAPDDFPPLLAPLAGLFLP